MATGRRGIALVVGPVSEASVQARVIVDELSRTTAFGYEQWWHMLEPWTEKECWPNVREATPRLAGLGFGPHMVGLFLVVAETLGWADAQG